ncbi:MAG: glucose-6-phosphate isomerase [Caldilineaceae bacterium SB0670_bin_27]|uniref:Glucose-6-phosphate isomerase n=1 Tax=Caldilineaceae bacterium SB0664_bin_27 TaxID=2605260 RepID=A0A6B0YQK2_9CHLR|nr:glucose-6-phosphate isomerase [Caldilineaceae bacterium SB0664_bin_27]MYJ80042.1 glucose-6-phosphate isomerase [Caldilineaceae bacterium SB0670_bin_27]
MWSDKPDEIVNRLGWLDIAVRMEDERHCISALLQDLQQEGYTQAVLLGMGGSSLAPEVFARVFGNGPLALQILDSTHPAAVESLADGLDPERTLFIVATKSGTTAETLSLFKFFYNRLQEQLGEAEAGPHFVAITDADSELVRLGKACNFRSVFINDANIGGRYSALSHFGLIPAALLGVNLRRLLRRGLETKNDCGRHITGSLNPGAQIGVVMAEMAKAGKDKLTVIADEEVASFADWLEQLIAESTGKSGTGIVPVVGEPAASPDAYGADRLFVHLQWSDTGAQDAKVQALIDAGHPVIRVRFRDRYDLGGQFFLWEFATAVAGARLGIHPFDQPDVESAKQQSRKMMSAYMESGSLPAPQPSLEASGLRVYLGSEDGDRPVGSAVEALADFVKQAAAGDYISVQAYMQPCSRVSSLLQTMQECLRDRTMLATTTGYGPRFLHSTGQLHKGDRGNGLFIQLTDRPSSDVDIPDEPGSSESGLPFGVLIEAQSLGDRQALMNAGRRVIRIDLGEDAPTELERLVDSLATV